MGRRPMTAEQRARMRARILDAARERFLEDGLEGLSMRGIASKVGVSSMTLYLYYDSRQDIVRHLVAEGFTKLNEALEDQNDAPVEERVELLGQAYLRFALENPRYYAAMFGYLARHRVNGSDELISPVSERALQLLEDALLSAGKTETAARAHAASIWCGLHGLALLSIGGQLTSSGVGTEAVREIVARA